MISCEILALWYISRYIVFLIYEPKPFNGLGEACSFRFAVSRVSYMRAYLPRLNLGTILRIKEIQDEVFYSL